MICFGRISLLCCVASRDVSVSAFRARMADAVSAGASAAVEELATSPPTQRTSSISAVAAEDRVRSVSFLLGGTVIGARATLLARCIGVRDRRVVPNGIVDLGVCLCLVGHP